jgi:hypothetical protein
MIAYHFKGEKSLIPARKRKFVRLFKAWAKDQLARLSAEQFKRTGQRLLSPGTEYWYSLKEDFPK